MFRQASRLFSHSVTTFSVRSFSSKVRAAASADSSFNESWKKVIPNIDLPRLHLPSLALARYSFFDPVEDHSQFRPSYSFELSAKEVDIIIIPATTGQMGVLPGHVPAIAELTLESYLFIKGMT